MKQLKLLPTIHEVSELINSAIANGYVVKIDGQVISESRIILDDCEYSVIEMVTPLDPKYGHIRCDIVTSVSLDSIKLDESDERHEDNPDGPEWEDTGEGILTFHEVSEPLNLVRKFG